MTKTTIEIATIPVRSGVCYGPVFAATEAKNPDALSSFRRIFLLALQMNALEQSWTVLASRSYGKR